MSPRRSACSGLKAQTGMYITLGDIQAADDLANVADELDVVVLERRSGPELQYQMQEHLEAYLEDVGRDTFAGAMDRFTDDPDHLIGVISAHIAPVAVARYDQSGGGLRKLMDYVERVVSPDEGV